MPPRGPSGPGGPRRKPKPRRSVGAAIQSADKPGLRGKRASGTASVGVRGRPAPQRKPKPKPKPKGTVFGRVGQQSGPISAASKAPGKERRTRQREQRRADKAQIAAAMNTVARASRRRARAADPNIPREVVRGVKKAPGVVDRELSGKGKVVPALGKAAKWLAKQSTGDPLGLTGDKAGVGISKDIRGREQLRRGAEDLFNAPATAASGVYLYGKAGAKAATGDTKPAKELLKGMAENDPLIVAARGDFKKALKLADEHPGFTAMEVYGVARGADLAAGRTVRGTGRALKGAGKVTRSKKLTRAGERVRRSAATETRPDSVVPETGARTFRRYDRGLVTQKLQKRRDRKRTRAADDLRQRADNLERTHGGSTETSAALRRQAAEVDPRVARPKDIKRREDIREAASESNRRRRMAEGDVAVGRALKGEKGAAANLVAQGIAKPNASDLRAYLKSLKREYDNIESPAKRAANEKLRGQIERSLKREQKKPGSLKRSGERAKAYAQISKMLDDDLARYGLLDKVEGERAILRRYAARYMDARKDPKKGHWVDKDGNHLSDGTIKRHMRDNGVNPDDLAYVSQRPNSTGSGSYYQSSYQEPRYRGRAASGSATRQGTFEGTPEAMRATVARRNNAISVAENYRGFLSENAARNSKTGRVRTFTSADQAKAAAASATDRTGVDFTVVRASPWGVGKKQLSKMVDDATDRLDPRMLAGDKSPGEQIASALKGDGDGPFVIVPEVAARRMAEHQRNLGPTDFGKFAQAGRAAFSRTVLATSPSPTFGNALEAGFRAALSRSGPVSAITYRRFIQRLRKVDPDAARRFEDNVLGSNRVSFQAARRHMDAGQFSDGPTRRFVARSQKFWGKKGPKAASDAWNAWTTFVFDIVNDKLIGRPAQKVMAGKAIRRSGLMDDGMLNLSSRAIDQAVRGYRNTPEQVRLARDLFDMYGRYRAFPASQRAAIQNYTPFLAWYWSSVNFVAKVLPRDHPILLATIASAAQVSDDLERQGKRPGWLRGTLNAGGTTWQASRNSPVGAFTNPLETGADLFLPFLSPLFAAGQGEDWKGKKLRNKDGSPYTQAQLAEYAITEILFSTVPALAIPDRGKAYAEKPGRLLNPVRVSTKSSDGEPKVKGKQKSRDPLDAQLEALDRRSQQDADKVLDAQLKALDKLGR